MTEFMRDKNFDNPKFQGKEFTANLQAPNEAELKNLIGGISRYAKQNGLESIRVVDMRPDPDGGWEAVIKAHNWNPLTWVKEKFRKKESPPSGEPAGELPEADIQRAYEAAQELRGEVDRERLKRTMAEEEVRQEKAAREARVKAEAQAEYEGRGPARPRTPEEILSRLPEKERKKYQKRIEEGKRAKTEAEMEIWESGIPGKKKVLKRTWNPVTQQHEYQEIVVSMSPQEQLAEARMQKLGGMLVEEEVAKLRQKKRERSTPYRAARAIGGFGQFVAGVTTLGAAGVARGVQPGRGGPQRAARMLAPSLPLDLYGVKPILGVGMPSARDLTGRGLGHLRGLAIPRVGRPKPKIAQQD